MSKSPDYQTPFSNRHRTKDDCIRMQNLSSMLYSWVGIVSPLPGSPPEATLSSRVKNGENPGALWVLRVMITHVRACLEAELGSPERRPSNQAGLHASRSRSSISNFERRNCTGIRFESTITSILTCCIDRSKYPTALSKGQLIRLSHRGMDEVEVLPSERRCAS